MADMDWLLSAEPSVGAVIGFEALLDRLVSELEATVLCAYRRTSFEDTTIVGALCVHPLRIGEREAPPFCLAAANGDSWRLSGEIDVATISQFAAALTATTQSRCMLDVAGLDFIDLAGMRTIAEVARSRDVSVHLRCARPALQRYWRLAGFDRLAPTVKFID